MLKLQTPVNDTECRTGISYRDRIMLIGSCFADNIGKALQNYGFNVCVNPFGTLYNPASIAAAMHRLYCRTPFTEDDCVQMGSGSDLICSFSHHTSFARPTAEEFLENANSSLENAADFFAGCNRVIITLGTAWCFRHIARQTIVANCLKRNAKEFSRELLGLPEAERLLEQAAGLCGFPGVEAGEAREAGYAGAANEGGLTKGAGKANAAGRVEEAGWVKLSGAADWTETARKHIEPKKIIFTVSPIRHLADGAHGNQVSKSTLLLAVDNFIRRVEASTGPVADYFPAYEIMMDELRDYRFYAEDMVHPSTQATGYILERFLSWALPASEHAQLEENIRTFRRSQHRPFSTSAQ